MMLNAPSLTGIESDDVQEDERVAGERIPAAKRTKSGLKAISFHNKMPFK